MKKGPKFLLTAVLVTALLLSLLPTPVSAEDGIIFMAVNDSMPYDLDDDTMPFWSGGMLYVPYELFENSALKIYTSYNRTDSILTLYNKVNSIYFYLNYLRSLDIDGKRYTEPALKKGSVVFVPAEFVCERFEIFYTYTEVNGYPLVRITNGRETYGIEEFVSQATSLADSKLVKYREAQEQGEGDSDAQTTPVTPPTPVPPPTPTPPAVPSTPDPELRSGSIALAVYPGESLSDTIELLKALELPALVVLESVSDFSGDELRRLVGEGFRVCITGESVNQLDRENEKLFAQTRTVTRFALCQDAQKAAEGGYVSCRWDMAAAEQTVGSRLIASITDEEDTVILCADLRQEDEVTLLSYLCEQDRGDRYLELDFVRIREYLFAR